MSTENCLFCGRIKEGNWKSDIIIEIMPLQFGQQYLELIYR